MKESFSTVSSYQSIEEIRLRKAALQKEIEADSAKIDEKWHSLFKKPEALSKSATPSQRISGIISSGAGVLDGILLVWKLYRKFKR
ncbi:MAG: hypothetical protein SPG89_04260 [Prevotella sp.]|uniref:hypothetical protein n=1 Tax=Prevotella sp. TaxID=59823 RepID=UPI002A9F68A3|nr:hypothetical protein [Prevotella sp.]MDD7190633.1 hypothetical protein [Prevotella sp.]MDY5313813.1 hypothetical protein [Prevotella sp.]